MLLVCFQAAAEANKGKHDRQCEIISGPQIHSSGIASRTSSMGQQAKESADYFGKQHWASKAVG